MQEINAWLLSSQNYIDGVALYRQYGTSDFLKEIFATGATPYNIHKLEAELIAMVPALPANTPAIKREQLPARQDPPIKKAKPVNGHVLYLALLEDNKTKYRQLERNMAELDLNKDERVLHETAKQILHLHKKISANYVLIDYFDEYGCFPAENEIKQLKTDEIQLLQQSISKAKKRIGSGKAKDIEKTKRLIDENQKRLIFLQSEKNKR